MTHPRRYTTRVIKRSEMYSDWYADLHDANEHQPGLYVTLLHMCTETSEREINGDDMEHTFYIRYALYTLNM